MRTLWGELAWQLGDDASLGAALVGLQQARMLRGAFHEIDAHAVEIAEVASRVADSVIANWGRLMAAVADLHRGRLVQARLQLAELANGVGCARQVSRESDGPSFPYGPLLFSNLAVTEWLVGHPDAAGGSRPVPRQIPPDARSSQASSVRHSAMVCNGDYRPSTSFMP